MGLRSIGEARVANQGIEGLLVTLIQNDQVKHATAQAQHAEILAEMKKQTQLLQELVRVNGGAA